MIKIFDTWTNEIDEMDHKEFKKFYEENIIDFYNGRYVVYGQNF